MLHIVWVVMVIFSGFICMQLAKFKGRSPGLWSALGVLFGPFALIVLLVLKSQRGDSE